MNDTQIKVIVAPIIGAVATWLASKWPLLDQQTWNTLISSLVFSGVAAYLASVTTKAPLANSVANYDDTKVVTDKKTADSLPNNASVISNTEVKVTAK